ncbi:hypothetical protein Tco_1230077 [Tanacetum coccineum]
MEAVSKDRHQWLAPGNYVQWKSRIKRYIDTKPNRNSDPLYSPKSSIPYIMAEKTVPVAEGSSETRKRWIDNDITPQSNACPNACEMWKAIERMKSMNQLMFQDLETN